MGLGSLLDRAELFIVSQSIKDQLVLALADLVTLVVVWLLTSTSL